MSAPFIYTINLTKKFDEQVVLRNININIEKGQIVGFVGRNGSGKTMLLRCIAGLVIPTQGQVFIDGKRIGRDGDFAQSTGVLIESPGYIPHYSARKNLDVLSRFTKRKSKEDISFLLHTVGLPADIKKTVSKYSMGMKQRLGLAMALLDDPMLLLLDEPMTSLDHQGVDDMRHLFMALKNKGKTILIASHVDKDIELLCDVTYQMHNGEIV